MNWYKITYRNAYNVQRCKWLQGIDKSEAIQNFEAETTKFIIVSVELVTDRIFISFLNSNKE